MVRVPTWTFHGSADSTVPFSESQKMVDALKAAGNEPRFTVYDGAGHGIAAYAYGDALVKWLTSQVNDTVGLGAELAADTVAIKAFLAANGHSQLPLDSCTSTVGRRVTELRLDDLTISDTSVDLSVLSHLQVLQLKANGLGALPSWVPKLEYLNSLRAIGNPLAELLARCRVGAVATEPGVSMNRTLSP